MKKRNPHVGESLEEHIAEQRQKDPSFRVAFDKLKLVRKLRRLRESQGLTQSALGERLGLAQSGVARFERGAPIPSWDLIIRVAEALGVGVRVELGERTSRRGASS